MDGLANKKGKMHPRGLGHTWTGPFPPNPGPKKGFLVKNPKLENPWAPLGPPVVIPYSPRFGTLYNSR